MHRIWRTIFCLMFCVLVGAPDMVLAEDSRTEEYKAGIMVAGPIDESEEGSILVKEMHGEGISYSIYQIASFAEDGEAYYTEEFYRYIDEMEIHPADVKTSEEAQELADACLALVYAHEIMAVRADEKTKADGTVLFESLVPGYYLVAAAGFTREDGAVYSANPALISVPGSAEAGNYQIVMEAKSELIPKETPEEPTNPSEPEEPTEPSKPEEPTEPETPDRPREPNLPVTGMVWWPVTVLAVAGIVLIIAGSAAGHRKKDFYDDDGRSKNSRH